LQWRFIEIFLPQTAKNHFIRNGEDNNAINAAYEKFITARAEYQNLNKATGNCINPGAGNQTNKFENGQDDGYYSCPGFYNCRGRNR